MQRHRSKRPLARWRALRACFCILCAHEHTHVHIHTRVWAWDLTSICLGLCTGLVHKAIMDAFCTGVVH